MIRLSAITLLAGTAAAAVVVANANAADHAYAVAETMREVPLQEILSSIQSKNGVSFIFDSRVIEGRKALSADDAVNTIADLQSALESAGLRLHQVSKKTYAISHAPPTVNTPIVVADPISEIAPLVDTILVLGAAPHSATHAGSKRIFEISAEDLSYLNTASAGEAIYALPQSLASITPANTALFASAAGLSLADLRGLDPKRTLVLVNGRRRTISPGGNGDIAGVDLGTIAETLLERIEVQNLPGGARFGASAVAGTVNFVTRSGLSGVEAGARAGVSERGDSEEISLHAIGGGQLRGLGALTVGMTVSRTEGIIGADRSFASPAYGFAVDGLMSSAGPNASFLPGFGGSSTTDVGLINGVVLADGSVSPFKDGAAYIPAPGGGAEPFNGARDQLFNWVDWQSIILPNDRVTGILSFESGDDEGVRLFLDAQGGHSAIDGNLAPLPATPFSGADPVTGDAAVIPLDNPFLPQSIRDIAEAEFGGSASAVVFTHRYEELGPRRQKIDRRFYDIAAGVSVGDHARSLALTYRYGRNRAVSRELDRIDLARLNIALDASTCAATAGCAPVDFFTTPEISAAALDFITIPELVRTLTTQEHEASLIGSMSVPSAAPKGARISAGVEYRSMTYKDRDIPVDAQPIGYIGGGDLDEAIETFDLFVDWEGALFDSDDFPGAIDASLSSRLTYSKEFDVAMNLEGGVDWEPAPGLSLFTRQHVGERTPNIIELYSIGRPHENSFTDPCAEDPAVQSSVVVANCLSDGPLGVGTGFSQTSNLATSVSYGNPALKPEQVRTGTYGVTIIPGELFGSFPGRMQLTAAWMNFRISNVVSDSGSALRDCYSSPGFSSPHCGLNPRTGAPTIVRDPVTRQITSVDYILYNEGSLLWRGLDLELRYAVNPQFLPVADSIWISVIHSYTNKVVREQDGSVERLDGLIDYPHHRTLASLGVDAGPWSIVAFANRRGRALTVRSTRPEAEAPAELYLDLTGRLNLSSAAYIQAGIKNITDNEPEITAFNDIGNFAPEHYDPIGRRYTLSLQLNF